MSRRREFPHILLVGNSAYTNRGCEAIARGTMVVLRRLFGERFRVTAATFDSPGQIREQALGETDPLVRHVSLTSNHRTYSQLVRRVRARLRMPFAFPHINRLSRSAVVALEIGGDNYSLDYGVGTVRKFIPLDRQLMAHGVPVILWGASVGPFDKEPLFAREMLEHLRHVKAIFVRENVSRAYLAANGVVDNVHDMADPAFVMEPTEPSPDRLGTEVPAEVIGVNLSPLMARFVTGGDSATWVDRCARIVESIVDATGKPVLLIPHVTASFSNDHAFMREVHEALASRYRARVAITTDRLTATETKWVISRCLVFVGARTHTTIAGMSSFVPTLSLAYSIKAVGINQEVYGTQDYCVRPEAITPGEVAERIVHMLSDRVRIQSHLEGRIPGIRDKVYEAGSILGQLLGEHLG